MNSLWDIRIFLGLVPKESPCTWRKTCPSATLSVTNITRTDLESHPVLRAERALPIRIIHTNSVPASRKTLTVPVTKHSQLVRNWGLPRRTPCYDSADILRHTTGISAVDSTSYLYSGISATRLLHTGPTQFYVKLIKQYEHTSARRTTQLALQSKSTLLLILCAWN